MPLTESDLDVAVRTYDSPTVAVGLEDLRDLLREREQLRKQVDELQAAATKTAENSRARRVRAFHLRFGHTVAWSPVIPPETRVRFRAKLIGEEFLEFIAAIFDTNAGHVGDFVLPKDFTRLKTDLWHVIENAVLQVDMVEAMDALEDMDFVIEGTRAEFGVNGDPIAAEVNRANMAKGPNGENGKPTKPPGWTPPDVLGCLRAQGWRPPGEPWAPSPMRPLVGVRPSLGALPGASSTVPAPPEEQAGDEEV